MPALALAPQTLHPRRFGAGYGHIVLGAAPHSVLQLRLPITPPQTLSTKVGTSEIPADFRLNNYRRGLQQRAKVRNHRGVGESVPEPQRLKGFE
jgi:hypothetical protein